MLQALARRFGFEKRDSSYTDAVIASILTNASDASSAASTSALESCSGLVGRAFASAKVTGQRSQALSPSLMMLAGRALIRQGEVLFLVRAGTNGVELVPVSSWNIEGEFDPKSWTYQLTLAGPTRQTTVQASWGDVIHIRTNASPGHPWRGVAAVDSAKLSSDLAVKTTRALSDEAGSPRGSFIPVPASDTTELSANVTGAKGAALVVESMSANWGGSGPPPTKEWESRRFGFDAPDSLLKAMEMGSDGVMAAIGISAAIFRASDAAAAVAAYRHFAHSVVSPLGRLLVAEVREKLDSPDIKLDFADLRAADVNARARSFKQLVQGGMAVKEALGLSGLLAAEG